MLSKLLLSLALRNHLLRAAAVAAVVAYNYGTVCCVLFDICRRLWLCRRVGQHTQANTRSLRHGAPRRSGIFSKHTKLNNSIRHRRGGASLVGLERPRPDRLLIINSLREDHLEARPVFGEGPGTLARDDGPLQGPRDDRGTLQRHR